MFEVEIDNIIKITQAKTVGDAEKIPLPKILSADIPKPIKIFFRAQVEQWLREEKSARTSSKRFNEFHSDVQSLQQQIDLLMLKNFTFEREEFLQLLDDAVHLQFNYLCRPQWTLQNFLFNNTSTSSTKEIEFKLNYFSDFKYFKEILLRYFSEKGLVQIQIDEFRTLVKRIDAQIVQQHNSRELANLTLPISVFLNKGQEKTGDAVPVDALIVFFDDKELLNIKERLEIEKAKIQELSIDELANLIEKVRTGDEQAVAPAIEQKEEVEEKILPFDFSFSSRETTVVPPPQPQQKSRWDSDALPFSPVDAENIAKLFGTQEELFTPPVLKNLQELLTIDERKKILRKIFKKDQAQFEQAIETLNTLKTWEEASVYLDEIFIMNDIDPFSKAAVKFTDIVHSRYEPLEKK